MNTPAASTRFTPSHTESRSAAAAQKPVTSVLGPSLRFKGELHADEDLLIQGQLEGSIEHTRSLTIGTEGGVKGNIRARIVIIDGTVEGDVHGLESDRHHPDSDQGDGKGVAPEPEEQPGSVFDRGSKGAGKIEKAQPEQQAQNDEDHSPKVVGLTTEMFAQSFSQALQPGSQSDAPFACGHPLPPATTLAGGRPFGHVLLAYPPNVATVWI